MTGTSLWPWLDDFKWSELEVFTPKPGREVDLDALPLKLRRGMLAAALISVGLVGALAWVWGRRKRTPELAPVLAATPPVFAESAPRLVPIVLPQTADELDEILGVARKCFDIAPSHPDHEMASLAWGFIWKGVPFPGRPRQGDHPSIGQALDVVLHAIAVARAEACDRGGVAEMAKRPPKPIEAVCLELADLSTLAGKAAPCAGYVDPIRSSKWNAERLEPLRAGVLLWLPPLRQLRLLDRTRVRRAARDPSPWPDGSSKLEPPPTQWAVAEAESQSQVVVGLGQERRHKKRGACCEPCESNDEPFQLNPVGWKCTDLEVVATRHML